MRSSPLRSIALLAALPLLLGACGAVPGFGGPRRLETWAFTAPWDAASAASLRAHAGQLDAAVLGWFQLDSVTGQPTTPFPDTLSPLAPATTRRMAIVSSYAGSRFHPEAVRQLAASDSALGAAAGAVARQGRTSGYRGIVLDFEAHPAADLPTLVRVVRAFADSARAHGVGPTTVAVPAVDTAAYPAHAFTPAADYVLVMLYDQHWATSPPGAIAAPDWARRALETRIADVGASRIVAGLPLYGYQWRTGQPTRELSFDAARREAAAAGTPLDRDPASQTLRAVRPGEWDIWVSDAGLVDTLLREVRELGVPRVALWRLGQEDEGVWAVIAK